LFHYILASNFPDDDTVSLLQTRGVSANKRKQHEVHQAQLEAEIENNRAFEPIVVNTENTITCPSQPSPFSQNSHDQFRSPIPDKHRATVSGQDSLSEDEEVVISTIPSYLLQLASIFLIVSGFYRRSCNQMMEKCHSAEPAATDIVSDKSCQQEAILAMLNSDNETCFKYLRSGKVSVHKRDIWGATILFAACKGGSVPIIEQLLHMNANVNALDSWDDTPLHVAARNGHLEACRILLQHGASKSVINAQDWSPLVVAAHAHQEAVCEFLLDETAGTGSMEESELPSMLIDMMSERGLVTGSSQQCPISQDSFLKECISTPISYM